MLTLFTYARTLGYEHIPLDIDKPLEANVVIAVGNCGLYTGPWGVRVEDTVVAGDNRPLVLTDHPRQLQDN